MFMYLPTNNYFFGHFIVNLFTLWTEAFGKKIFFRIFRIFRYVPTQNPGEYSQNYNKSLVALFNTKNCHNSQRAYEYYTHSTEFMQYFSSLQCFPLGAANKETYPRRE